MNDSVSYLTSFKRRKIRLEHGTINVSIPKRWVNFLELKPKQTVFLNLNLNDDSIRIYSKRPEKSLTTSDTRYEKRKIRRENGTLNVSIPIEWLSITGIQSHNNVILQANVKSKLIYVFYNKSE